MAPLWMYQIDTWPLVLCQTMPGSRLTSGGQAAGAGIAAATCSGPPAAASAEVGAVESAEVHTDGVSSSAGAASQAGTSDAVIAQSGTIHARDQACRFRNVCLSIWFSFVDDPTTRGRLQLSAAP
jgi:hypothetical protein